MATPRSTTWRTPRSRSTRCYPRQLTFPPCPAWNGRPSGTGGGAETGPVVRARTTAMAPSRRDQKRPVQAVATDRRVRGPDGSHYRRQFGSGFSSAGLDGRSWLDLPILSRKALQEAGSEIQSGQIPGTAWWLFRNDDLGLDGNGSESLGHGTYPAILGSVLPARPFLASAGFRAGLTARRPPSARSGAEVAGWSFQFRLGPGHRRRPADRSVDSISHRPWGRGPRGRTDHQ